MVRKSTRRLGEGQSDEGDLVGTGRGEREAGELERRQRARRHGENVILPQKWRVLGKLHSYI